jgi:hypothetical protein
VSDDNRYFSHIQHRLLSAATWVLFLMGMLAWFIQGANRPLDPVVSPALVLLHLAF